MTSSDKLVKHRIGRIDETSRGWLQRDWKSGDSGRGKCSNSSLWTLSRTTQVSRYQKKHSPTHTYRGHQSSLICFLHLLQSMASYLFNLHALQCLPTISLQVFFVLPLGLAPSTSYSIHFFTQSLSSFRSIYHCNLFCCITEIMSSNPSLSLNPLLGTLPCSLKGKSHQK